MKSTLSSLLLALIFFSACSNDGGMALMDKANKAVKDKKTNEAIQLYQQIITEYPNGKFAPEAQYRMATLYLMEKKLEKAVQLLEDVDAKYPKSEYGHKSLFVAGFTYSNDLGNIEKARSTYQSYLQKYPDSNMAETARFELQNLGKTTDEILAELQESAKADSAAKSAPVVTKK